MIVNMLKDYVGKNVRVLVFSCSGTAAVSSGERYSNGVMSGVINFYGVVGEFDDKFIELKDVRYALYTFDSENPVGLNYPISINTQVFENNKILINLGNVIAIAII